MNNKEIKNAIRNMKNDEGNNKKAIKMFNKAGESSSWNKQKLLKGDLIKQIKDLRLYKIDNNQVSHLSKRNLFYDDDIIYSIHEINKWNLNIQYIVISIYDFDHGYHYLLTNDVKKIQKYIKRDTKSIADKTAKIIAKKGYNFKNNTWTITQKEAKLLEQLKDHKNAQYESFPDYGDLNEAEADGHQLEEMVDNYEDYQLYPEWA